MLCRAWPRRLTERLAARAGIDRQGAVMDVARLNQVLTIFAWFPLVVLLAILLFIARFYQQLTGEKTRYPLYVVPMVLFGLAAADYAIAAGREALVRDGLMFAGGAILLGLCLSLYRQMTAGR